MITFTIWRSRWEIKFTLSAFLIEKMDLRLYLSQYFGKTDYFHRKRALFPIRPHETHSLHIITFTIWRSRWKIKFTLSAILIEKMDLRLYLSQYLRKTDYFHRKTTLFPISPYKISSIHKVTFTLWRSRWEIKFTLSAFLIEKNGSEAIFELIFWENGLFS